MKHITIYRGSDTRLVKNAKHHLLKHRARVFYKLGYYNTVQRQSQ